MLPGPVFALCSVCNPAGPLPHRRVSCLNILEIEGLKGTGWWECEAAGWVGADLTAALDTGAVPRCGEDG